MNPAGQRPARFKIIHVITRMDLGGAQGNTLHTVSRLDPARFDVVLATGRGGTLDPDLEAAAAPARVAFVDGMVREISPGRDLLALLELWNLFLREKPGVVHTHSSKAGVLGRLAAWLARVPVVVHTYHGFGFHDHRRHQPRLVRNLYILAERFCCGRGLTSRAVFVSKANIKDAERHRLIEADRRSLIRSGIRLADYPARLADKPAKLASLGLGDKKRLVTSVGNLKPQKNPERFYALASMICQDRAHRDVGFLFVGEGPLRRKLERMAAQDPLGERLRGSLVWAGWRRDIPELLAASDVFVLTSLWEGLPRALVEAMATGLPSVCYETDGVADIVQDGKNGFLVPQHLPGKLDERVRQLLDDADLRRRMGEAARASITDEFDIDLMVRKQEELYSTMLARAGAGSR